MDRVRFQLGSNDHLLVNLPSRAPGTSDVFRGRVRLRVGALGCSQPVDIAAEHLAAFFAGVRRVHDVLRGEFALASVDGAFSLAGSATPTGHIAVRVALGASPHEPRDDAFWHASAAFTIDNYLLLRVATATTAI